jgi:hypothetical protein
MGGRLPPSFYLVLYFSKDESKALYSKEAERGGPEAYILYVEDRNREG